MLHVINIFCICSLTNTLFFGAPVTLPAHAPQPWCARECQQLHENQRCCSAVGCRDPKDQVDAAGIFGDAGQGVSMDPSQERRSCSGYTAATLPWRDSHRAIKPLATADVCRYFQINPGRTNPGILNRRGLASQSLGLRVGRSSSSQRGKG